MEKFIEVKFKDEILKGYLINETKDEIILKLNNGYNANLKKENIEILSEKNIELEQENTTKEDNKEKSLPNITILHTGGTIASKVDYRTGAVSSQFTPEEILGLYPELKQKANLNVKMVSNIFSENMRFSEYNKILEEIKNVPKEIDGVIISHGTDTMHYTSAALQYSIKNLKFPVILVGAQRSSDRPSSDASSNLKNAIDFIISQKKEKGNNKKSFNRVGICMHETINDDSYLILDGLNAKKMHSTKRNAFRQINYSAFARVKNSKVEILRKELQTKNSSEEIEISKIDENLKIGFLKTHPNMFAEEVEIYKYYDIIVVEGTGVGHIAENQNNKEQDKKVLKALSNLCKNSIVISGVQTVFGEVSLDVYSTGRDMQTAGIIGNRQNLISETSLIRAAFILSKYGKENFKDNWDKNFEGFEIKNLEIK